MGATPHLEDEDHTHDNCTPSWGFRTMGQEHALQELTCTSKGPRKQVLCAVRPLTRSSFSEFTSCHPSLPLLHEKCCKHPQLQERKLKIGAQPHGPGVCATPSAPTLLKTVSTGGNGDTPIPATKCHIGCRLATDPRSPG